MRGFRVTALRAAGFVMVGLAAGRLVGIVVDGATDVAPLRATAGEAVLGGPTGLNQITAIFGML